MSKTWDYTALRAPASPEEVAAFRKAAKASGRYGTGGTVAATVVVVVVGIVVLTVAGFFAAIVLGIVLSAGSNAGAPSVVPLVVLLIIVALAGVGVGLLLRRASRTRWTNLLRQSRFAEANDLLFSARDANPTYPGAIFGLGSERAARDHFRASKGRYLDFGNYRYTTGSGKNRSTHNWGFLALRLNRSLPHMVLDSRSNNGLFGGTNLPVSFQRDQVLSLEGDFDKHFTLYCPREYESDALYVLTPDLMALLIDGASGFDVEIVDDWMFVYSAITFDMTDPGAIERLRLITETVGTKTLSQTERYADDRASAGAAAVASASPLTARMQSNTVAPGGRRLKKRFSMIPLIVFAAVAAFQLFRLFSGG